MYIRTLSSLSVDYIETEFTLEELTLMSVSTVDKIVEQLIDNKVNTFTNIFIKYDTSSLLNDGYETESHISLSHT